MLRAWSGAAAYVSGNAPPTRFSHRAPRECPLKRCLGPKRATFRWALDPKIGLRRHVRSRPIPRTLQPPVPRYFEVQVRSASRPRGKPRPNGVPGMTLCQKNLTATHPVPHKVHAGLPRGARCGLLFRLRGRPPARHRRGRSPLNPRSAGERVRPSSRSEDGSDRSQARVGSRCARRTSNQPTRDHADGAMSLRLCVELRCRVPQLPQNRLVCVTMDRQTDHGRSLMAATDKKLRVALIFGGRSGEHDVSVVSARSVAAALDRDRYEIIPMAIDHGGRWADPETAARVLAESGDRTDQVLTFEGKNKLDPRLARRRGGRGLPRPARTLRRRRNHPGALRDAESRLCRMRPHSVRCVHGQGAGQEAPGPGGAQDSGMGRTGSGVVDRRP